MKRNLKMFVTVLGVLMIFNTTRATAQVSSIYQLQSLFLYNFAKHVKWENIGGTFTVGVYGNSEAFKEIKASMEKKKAWGNFIKVIEITSPADVGKCQIVFLPKSDMEKEVEFIKAARNVSNTLLVTEDDLVNEGAAISFIYQQSKMNFKISKDRIEQCGLKVSTALVSIGIAA